MSNYNELDYASAVTRVRTLEAKNLSRTVMDKMIAAKTQEDAIHILAELGWPRFEEYETVLSEELRRTIVLLEALGGEPVLKLFRNKYDFHNLKVLLKSEFTGTNAEQLLIDLGNYSPEVLKMSVLNRDYRKIHHQMAIAIEAVLEDYAKRKDPQMIDLLLDNAMFKLLLEYAKEQPDELVYDFIRTQIDLYNIKTFLRLRAIGKSYQFIELSIAEGGYVAKDFYLTNAGITPDKIESIFAFTPYATVFAQGENIEKATEQFLKEKRRIIKMKAFGLSPLYDYLLHKETEISNARMIFTCRQTGLSPEAIQAKLII